MLPPGQAGRRADFDPDRFVAHQSCFHPDKPGGELTSIRTDDSSPAVAGSDRASQRQPKLTSRAFQQISAGLAPAGSQLASYTNTTPRPQLSTRLDRVKTTTQQAQTDFRKILAHAIRFPPGSPRRDHNWPATQTQHPGPSSPPGLPGWKQRLNSRMQIHRRHDASASRRGSILPVILRSLSCIF